MRLHVGFEKETGEPVHIELSQRSPHIACFGQTGLGKTEFVRRIIEEICRADPSYRILVFDTRADVEEFRGQGNRLPIYVRETTDPLVLKGLLESIIRSSLKREYATLVRVAEGAQDYQEIIDRLSKRIEDKRTHAVVKDMMVLLRDLLQRLMSEMRDVATARDVHLEPGLNVMSLNDRSKEFKQLTVRAVLPHVYRKYRKMVVFLDEGQEYIPQRYSSAATEAVDDYIRTARGKEDYLVIAAQSITGTNKDPIKNVHTWFHFGQATRGEAKEALEYIPHADRLKLTIREIQTMGTGWAIVNTKEWAKVTYVQPVWLPDDVAREVAMGKRSPHEVQKWEREIRVRRMEEEERRKFEAEIERLRKELKANHETWQKEIEKAVKRREELQEVVERQRVVIADLERRLQDAIKSTTEEKSAEIPVPSPESVEAGRSPLEIPLTVAPIYETGGIPLEALAQKVAEMIAAPEEYRLNLRVGIPELSVKKHVVVIEASDRDNTGRFALLIGEGWLDSPRTIPDLQKEFRQRGWGTWSGGAGKNNMMKIATKMATLGFVRIDGDTVTLVPGVKDRIKVMEE